jgi:PTS system nitrogen regulatory IIA component
MTDLDDLIAPDAVFADVAAASKKAVLAALGTISTTLWALDARMVTDALSRREKLGSTGFGGGVAIPHARIDGLSGVRVAFVRLARPIDFAAVDDQPVDLVVLLLSPTDAGADHLKALARVSRRLREAGLAAKLRGAGSPDALYALLAGTG